MQHRLSKALAVFVVLSYTPVAAQENEHFVAPHITVTGSSFVEVIPDLAMMRLGVISEKPTAADAEAENASLATSVIAMLKGLGIEEKNIRTSSLTLSPVVIEERDPKTNGVVKRTLTGYRASNFLDVTIREVAKAGSIASKLIEAGANTFQSLTFEVSDYGQREDEQRAKAVSVAMHRARLFASGAAMKLGRLLAIDPEPDRNDGNAADLPTSKIAAGPRTLIIPVEPGTVSIGARVTATWELFPSD